MPCWNDRSDEYKISQVCKNLLSSHARATRVCEGYSCARIHLEQSSFSLEGKLHTTFAHTHTQNTHKDERLSAGNKYLVVRFPFVRRCAMLLLPSTISSMTCNRRSEVAGVALSRPTTAATHLIYTTMRRISWAGEHEVVHAAGVLSLHSQISLYFGQQHQYL